MERLILDLIFLLSTVAVIATADVSKETTVFYSICNETVSCSSQISAVRDLDDNACLIKTRPFCISKKPEIKNPAFLENEASFRASIIPFLYDFNYVSFNISMTTSNSDVTGFYFFITQKTENKTSDYESCRIFDFNDARKSYSGDISLHYDCYRKMRSQGFAFFDVMFHAYPFNNNKELIYRMYIPTMSEIESTNLCDWAPLTMINTAALQRNTIELKFSPSPNNIERYLVLLNTTDGQPILAKHIESTQLPPLEMYKVVFDDVPMGEYLLNIRPINSSNSELNCHRSKTIKIEVTSIGNFNHQFIFAIIICGSLVVVVLLGFIMHKLCHRSSHRGSALQEVPKPKCVIIYSYDCPQHFKVVKVFAEYLRSCCDMEVSLDALDKGLRETDNDWLLKELNKSQFVIVIISRGVFHKDKTGNNPEMKEGNLRDNYTPAMTFLTEIMGKPSSSNNEDGSQTHVIKVLFDYSRRSYVPSKLVKIGPTFHLLNQINPFLCEILEPDPCMICRTLQYIRNLRASLQIHCQQSKVFPIKIYPKMPGSDFNANSKGKELVDAIEAMKTFQKMDEDWFSKVLERDNIDLNSAGGVPMERVEEENKEDLENELDDDPVTQLNKNANSSGNEEKSPECQGLLEKVSVEKV